MNAQALGTRLVTDAGGTIGQWRVLSLRAVRGEWLSSVERLAVSFGGGERAADALWSLQGVTSNVRYIDRPEQTGHHERQPPLARPEASRAALIPIRKSTRWWEMTQEERREVFEEQPHHVGDSMTYLPAVARRLVHCRDLGEPFDFLTWFEYAPQHAERFEELVDHLRRSTEWQFVEREVDLRLARE